MASAVSGLPTGTVSLLLADVEGSTRLWETQPDAMTAAIARLDATLSDLVAIHDGVRPVEQGEGDSFVVAFARASDAVACALALQRAPLAPIRLRIGVNTGEIQLRDEGNYIGPTINRTARIRDLGHGGQTLLSGATESMVLDHLPEDAWLNDLGAHPLRDLPRPERVVQLCHPDIRNDFPALRTTEPENAQRLPAQLTSFVGRERADHRTCASFWPPTDWSPSPAQAGQVRRGWRFRSRAIIGDDVGYVDLAPITDLDLVPVAVSRALGLPDQPGRSTMDSVVRLHRGSQTAPRARQLRASARCERRSDRRRARGLPGLTVVTTSREPIGLARRGHVAGAVAVAWPTKPIELFTDRARRVRPISPSPTTTPRRSPRSADGSTACRLPSSWRPHGCARCR